MRTQLHARVHHSRTVPSALALATRAAFSTAEASDFRCQLALSSDCPSHSCSADRSDRLLTLAHPGWCPDLENTQNMQLAGRQP